MSAPRPMLGARVRVRGTTGIPNVAGRVGYVIAHLHGDPAILVELIASGRQIVVEPEDVDIAESPDGEPAGVGEGARE